MIDTTITSAAGDEDATALRAILCREFLNAVIRTSHRLVMTAAIAAEWRRRQSGFTRRWRRQMYAHRRVVVAEPWDSSGLSTRLASLALTNHQKEAIEKDMFLLEAALATDRSVVSLDAEIRGILNRAARTISVLRSVVWVNPEREEDAAIAWLEHGARPDPERCLGFESGV